MRTIRNQNSAASCTAFGLCSMVNPGTAKAMRSATRLLGLAIWASHSTSGEFGKALARARDDHGARVDRSRRRLRGSPICAPSQTLAYPSARLVVLFDEFGRPVRLEQPVIASTGRAGISAGATRHFRDRIFCGLRGLQLYQRNADRPARTTSGAERGRHWHRRVYDGLRIYTLLLGWPSDAVRNGPSDRG